MQAPTRIPMIFCSGKSKGNRPQKSFIVWFFSRMFLAGSFLVQTASWPKCLSRWGLVSLHGSNRAASPPKAVRDVVPLPKLCSKFQCESSSASHQVVLAEKTLRTQWMSDVTCCSVCQWRTYVVIALKLCVLASPFAVLAKWPQFCLFCTENLRPRISFANVYQMTDSKF